jgi:glyoxylase-like metal-dependent hydrolase (beta-lactamase superfamily II)
LFIVEDGNQLILIDTGWETNSLKILWVLFALGTHSLDNSLAKYGFHRDDITDVFMTHLHFDHCGGSIQWNKDKTGYEPAFKIFWTNENHWNGQQNKR